MAGDSEWPSHLFTFYLFFSLEYYALALSGLQLKDDLELLFHVIPPLNCTNHTASTFESTFQLGSQLSLVWTHDC